ncbi:hypothetical protein [Rhizobium paknamense]|uniref:Uncharacterized protein n=1 Tax=Rhizobium paknamense TaxID=1206817 RepID=A0ABU0IF10_9HYPH|nr:hypothetical protein [Rhizobium paknamense]MDQ0456761.1 hypothetical protein [Rhizobium paknamense]
MEGCNDNLPDLLAQAFWDRPATPSERIAMLGEVARDAGAIGRHSSGDGLFSVEPAHFLALMLKEITHDP